MAGFSYYKGTPIPKGQRPCLVCQTATRGRTVLVHLGYGERVWLCEHHASRDFRTARGGRDFLATLTFASASAGALGSRRHRAISRFLATDAYTAPPPQRARPGSYAWPELRRAVEESCRRGTTSLAALAAICAAALRGALKTGWVRAPSLRTLRRWRAERRWELPGWTEPARLPKP